MDRLSLKAQERTVLGKKVKNLRRDGFIPAHVFGKKIETEHVSVKAVDFLKTFAQTGETGLIDLKIGAEKVRPVLVRDVQMDPLKDTPLHIDFYQVNLTEKVTVPVPVVLIGEEPEAVKMGEAVVIQPLGEVEVEALPTDLPEKIEVDITPLQQINDTIFVSQMPVPEGVTVLSDPEAVVAKLDSAVTEEMKKLLEEQAAEAAAAAEAVGEETGETAEGETPAEGEEATVAVEGGEAVPAGRQEAKEEPSEDKNQP